MRDRLLPFSQRFAPNQPLTLYKAYMKAFALIDDESFSKEYRKLFGDFMLRVGKIEVRENLESLKEFYDT